jgi:RNA-directed DNA polymerase
MQLREIRDALWQHRHAPLDEQGSWRRQIVGGYFAYHAVPTNSTALSEFRGIVIWHRLRGVHRRGQRDKTT